MSLYGQDPKLGVITLVNFIGRFIMLQDPLAGDGIVVNLVRIKITMNIAV